LIYCISVLIVGVLIGAKLIMPLPMYYFKGVFGEIVRALPKINLGIY